MRMYQSHDAHLDFYTDIDRSGMILRDYLAVDRTILSNQNTFLAYIRTALTLFVVGLTFIKFFGGVLIAIIGWTFIPIGIATFIVGMLRYNRLRGVLAQTGRVRKRERAKSV